MLGKDIPDTIMELHAYVHRVTVPIHIVIPSLKRKVNIQS